MFKACILFTVLAFVVCASAKPAVVAYNAPGVVTSQSSQYIARNYNGVAAAPVVAAAYTAPAVAAAPVAAAYSVPAAAPVAAAYSVPAAAPVAAAYSAPVAAAYSAPVAAAYSAPVAAYSSYASYYPYNAAYTVAF